MDVLRLPAPKGFRIYESNYGELVRQHFSSFNELELTCKDLVLLRLPAAHSKNSCPSGKCLKLCICLAAEYRNCYVLGMRAPHTAIK